MTPLPLGCLAITPGALALLTAHGIPPGDLLARHMSGDWGERIMADDHDRRVTEQAVRYGGQRVLSCYEVAPGRDVWIITEWDRSATTILLPEEY